MKVLKGVEQVEVGEHGLDVDDESEVIANLPHVELPRSQLLNIGTDKINI